MKLMTKELLKRFERVGRQDEDDPLIIAKYFDPCGSATWYATSYDPETREFFGYVSMFGGRDDEWGYFSLDEMEAYRGKPFGLGIERDLWFREKHFSELKVRA